MVIGTAVSKDGVLIRLTQERWNHIIISHLEISPKSARTILNIVKNPDVIFKGDLGELLAVRKISGKKSWIVVVYKKTSQDDGFILTAYLTTDSRWLFQREVIWNKE